jgi:RNA polymerase sigma-70 factor (ECF subfamily)
MVEAAQRDPARFAELYQANFHRVYAYISSRVHERHEAEDITSEVFHEALAHIREYEYRGVPFIAWLMRIAAHAITDRWKKSSREELLADDDPDEGHHAATLERRALLNQLVDELPQDQRLIVVRRFIEQRSIRDIATELHRSEGAIKQLQFRALQTLRTLMRSHHA